MKRREFIKAMGGTAALGCAAWPAQLLSGEPFSALKEERVNGMPRRVLGRTGLKVSIVAFPGLALAQYDQTRGTEGLHSAFERGINYFDVAPAYGNGQCEIKMGIGLQGLKRDSYLLGCKTKKRDREGLQKELEKSLTVLKTDYFDLYQLHHLVTRAEVEQALRPGGAMEAVLKAKEQGKIKYIGFSAHTTRAALLALQEFRFDTVMFPINYVEYINRGFGREVLELANQQGAGVLAIKPMSRGAWPRGVTPTRKWWYRCTETAEEVSLGMRFAWSQKGVVAGIPPSWLDLVDRAIEAAKTPEPLATADLAKLQEWAKGCGSIFQAEEERAATALHLLRSSYPDAPAEGCPSEWA